MIQPFKTQMVVARVRIRHYKGMEPTADSLSPWEGTAKCKKWKCSLLASRINSQETPR